jgi:hypothetical protein
MQVLPQAHTSKAVRMRKPKFGMVLAGVLCASVWAAAAAAQNTSAGNQEPSLADAARKARAERKNEPPPKHVWTDDNIPKSPHEAAAAPAEAAAGTAEAGGGAKKGGEKPPEDENKKNAALEAEWRQKFAEAHKKLDNDQKDLDLMQRELSLKREQYYSDPNTAMRDQYLRDSGAGGEVNDLVKKIDDKKQDIEKDKQAISDLEDQLRKEGLPSGWSRTP